MFDLLNQSSPPEAKVACGTCTACCRSGEAIILAPQHGDDLLAYTTVDVVNPRTGDRLKAIPCLPDGRCIYLGESGCTIYERRPKMCRVFSCVLWVERVRASTTRAVRRRELKQGLLDQAVWKAGVARMPRGQEARG
jgi:Fe-S-cluster containining protein